MKILMMAGVVLACSAAGFGWAKLVGCPSGGCPLTATPWRGAAVGAFMGVVLALGMVGRAGGGATSAPVPGEEAILHVTGEAEFAALLVPGGKAVLVDFYADWCGPCRQFGPELAKFADRHRADVAVVKVNVDQSQELARKYEVSSIPAILLFRNGKLVKQAVGGMSTDALEAWVAEKT